jgi:hypothetical protein
VPQRRTRPSKRVHGPRPAARARPPGGGVHPIHAHLGLLSLPGDRSRHPTLTLTEAAESCAPCLSAPRPSPPPRRPQLPPYPNLDPGSRQLRNAHPVHARLGLLRLPGGRSRHALRLAPLLAELLLGGRPEAARTRGSRSRPASGHAGARQHIRCVIPPAWADRLPSLTPQATRHSKPQDGRSPPSACVIFQAAEPGSQASRRRRKRAGQEARTPAA